MLNNEEYIIKLSKISKSELIHPKEIYHDISKKMGWIDSERTVYKYFLEKYFRPKHTKQSKTISQLKDLIPGKIYTYDYDPKYKDRMAYYDGRPIMLCLKTKNEDINNLLLGLNFNFIPREVKHFMISSLWDTYSRLIEFNQTKIDKNQSKQQKQIFTQSYDYMQVLDNIWEYFQKTDYKFALRSYMYDRMSNIKEIEYSDWGFIPIITSKDMTGLELPLIFRDYWAEKLQNSREIPGGPKRKHNKKRLR